MEMEEFARRENLIIFKRRLAEVNDDAQRLFLPTNLSGGIEASDDPIINTRTEAYAESFGRRAK